MDCFIRTVIAFLSGELAWQANKQFYPDVAMLFARRRVKEDADLIYRVLAKENVGEEKKAGKGIAVMTIEPIEFPKRSSGSAGPMTGPVVPGARAGESISLFHRSRCGGGNRWRLPQHTFRHFGHSPPHRGRQAGDCDPDVPAPGANRLGSPRLPSLSHAPGPSGRLLAQPVDAISLSRGRRSMTSRRSGVRSRMTQITSNGSSLSTTASGSAT